MARRRRQEEHENHERWLVSYADFITLLFAFFVVMYSISSINQGKYKILSDSLDGIFNQSDRSIRPIPIGEEKPRTTQSDLSLVDEPPRADEDRDLQAISNRIEEVFGDLIKSDQLKVRGNEMWIEIELSSSLLFNSGDAIPRNAAFEIIEKVAKILAPYQNPIKVEGFTDNQPIRTAEFPTNWELSAARAASVVRMLAMAGVQPSRLAAVGYAEFQPVADNKTEQGRARNRRVVLVVSRNLDVRRGESKAGTQPAPAAAATVSPIAPVNSPTPAPQ